jgi:hypothetical protein
MTRVATEVAAAVVVVQGQPVGLLLRCPMVEIRNEKGGQWAPFPFPISIPSGT